MSLPNPGMDFTPFDVLPAASLDDMVENIEALADGSGLNTAAVPASKMKYGMLRRRQGGTSGDASYWTSGTTNTDTSAKDIFVQAGSIGTSSVSDTTITFPIAFNYVPLVLVSVNGGNAGTGGVTQNCFAEVVSKTTTTAVVRTFNTSGGQSDQNIAWLAIGQ